MGQTRSISGKDHRLSDDEMQAIRHLVWMQKSLGPKDGMIRYLAEMMIEQIRCGSEAAVVGGAQFALGDDALSDAGASI
ncbi:hypothetical protein [Shinella sp. BYT-45]|uniref:hypothetical protein n=1 Tax=Shinella sp. BYT-45 TaxID=3377377 RepID=UPI00397EE95D